MNQNLRVRRMEVGDLLRAAALEQSSFSQPWSEKLLAEGLNSPLDTYFVCTCENEIAGYCVLRVLADEGELQRIAVFSEYRRQGVGRKLMEAMLAAAREEGASSVSLEIRESNVGAMRLYEEYGFCQEAVRKKYYQEPEEDAVIMWNRSL